MAIAAAAAFPDRFAALASFHGGNLASDTATALIEAATRIKAEIHNTSSHSRRA